MYSPPCDSQEDATSQAASIDADGIAAFSTDVRKELQKFGALLRLEVGASTAHVTLQRHVLDSHSRAVCDRIER